MVWRFEFDGARGLPAEAEQCPGLDAEPSVAASTAVQHDPGWGSHGCNYELTVPATAAVHRWTAIELTAIVRSFDP